MKRWNTIRQIKQANADLGYHWFEPQAMRFFRTRISAGLYGGRYFVTSEQFVGSQGVAPRRYSVREALDDGSIETVGKFQGYDSLEAAKRAAKRLGEALLTVHMETAE